ncbi:MAG: ATP-binding protein [bacterium]
MAGEAENLKEVSRIKIFEELEQCANILSFIQEIIFIIDIEGKIIGYNKNFIESTSGDESFLKKDFRGILRRYWGNTDLEKKCEEMIGGVLNLERNDFFKDKEKEEFFLKINTPLAKVARGVINKKEGFFRVRPFPSFGTNKELRRIVCVINNITELKAIDENLKKVSSLYEKVLKNVPVGIVTLDKNGDVVYNNPYTEQTVGDRKGENIFSMDFIKKCKITGNFRQLFKIGEEFHKSECRYFNKKKNRTFYLDIRAVPLKDNFEEVLGAIAIFYDETESVEAKGQIEELNRGLENKIAERTRQLKDAIDLKTRFIADASHELRTPLTIMRGNLDLIAQKEFLDDESKEMLELVASQVDYMAKMLIDLTMLASGNKEFSGMKMNKFSLTKLVDEVAKVFAVVASNYSIKVSLKKSGSSKEIIIVGDEEKIERMIANLVSNAIKYGKENGWIKISLNREEKFIVIAVEDNGIGISKKDLPNIFERFYRIDQSRTKINRMNEEEGGTGLGLSICKWIAEIHGGWIRVESKVGKGSIFRVFLPILTSSKNLKS